MEIRYKVPDTILTAARKKGGRRESKGEGRREEC